MAIFAEQLKDLVWRKGRIVENYDPAKWRQDFAGAWMCYDLFGCSDDYGWSIEHLRPLSKGGEDSIDNLIPCQWHNNVVKANNYPEFKSAITSEGNRNIRKEQSWVVR